MNRKPRHALEELAEAKRILSKARDISGVKATQIAAGLGGTHTTNADQLFSVACERRHMRLGDLLKLSKQPEFREFVLQVLSAIQRNVDYQHLRVCDLDEMSAHTATADLARVALRDVASRLWPEHWADTRDPDGSERTTAATDDLHVRAPGEAANGNARKRR